MGKDEEKSEEKVARNRGRNGERKREGEQKDGGTKTVEKKRGR